MTSEQSLIKALKPMHITWTRHVLFIIIHSFNIQTHINNVHDSHMHDDIANNSICAPNYLDLKLNNKGFKIGCLNV